MTHGRNKRTQFTTVRHWPTILLGIVCSISLLPSPGYTETLPTLEISEVLYDASGSDTDHEWVELHNQGETNVTIITGSGANSWRFFDTSNHTLTLVQGQSSLGPNSFAVLAQNPSQFLLDYPGFSGTIFKVALSLPNSSATLKLSADKGSTYFGERTYSNAFGAAGDGHTLEWSSGAWQPSAEVGGTPGKPILVHPSTAPSTPSPSPSISPSTGPNPGTTASPSPTSSPTMNPPALAPPINPIAEPPSAPITPRMIITKIAYNPAGSDTNHEWIELQNNGSVVIPIRTGRSRTAWRLAVNTTHHTLTADAEPGILYPGDRIIIADNSENFRRSFPRYHGIILSSNLGLSNQEATIGLSIDGGASWLAHYHYQASDGANGDGRILQRMNNGTWRTNTMTDEWDGSETSPVFLDPQPSIVINEFLPHPEASETEWLELRNLTDRPISLSGWGLTTKLESANSSITFDLDPVDSTIGPASYYLLEKSHFHSQLPNTTGELHLVDSEERIVNSVYYSTAAQGLSWIRLADGTSRWTQLPTPGSPNQLVDDLHPALASAVAETDTPPLVMMDDKLTILDQHEPVGARPDLDTLIGQSVRVDGRVVRSLSRQVILVDGPSGKEVRIDFHLAAHSKPLIHKQDHLIANGQLSRVRNQLHLQISRLEEIEIIQRQPPAPRHSRKSFSHPTKPRQPIIKPESAPIVHPPVPLVYNLGNIDSRTWTIWLPVGMLLGLILLIGTFLHSKTQFQLETREM